jgi:head-tail adaptor
MAATAQELRTKLIIERKAARARDTDDWSEATEVWDVVGSVRAKIAWSTGDERLHSNQIIGVQACTITTRFTNRISITDRLRDASTGQLFHIDGLANERMGGRFLVINATAAETC